MTIVSQTVNQYLHSQGYGSFGDNRAVTNSNYYTSLQQNAYNECKMSKYGEVSGAPEQNSINFFRASRRNTS
jgi:hypothetical protein